MSNINGSQKATNVNYVATVMRWTLLALGAGQLSLVLTGPATYFAINSGAGLLFSLSLILTFQQQTEAVIKLILSATLLLCGSTLLYDYAILLDIQPQLVVTNFLGTLAFCVVGLLTFIFGKRHVAR